MRRTRRFPSRIASFLWKGALLSLLFAPAAHAEIERSAYGREVTRVELVGVDDAQRTALRAGLELVPRRSFLGWDRARLQREAVQRDVDRIALYLARQGFPQAAVDAEIAKRDGDGVVLRLRVTPGTPVVVADVVLDGYPEALERPVLRLERGRRFRDADVEAARRALQSALAEGGYARAALKRTLQRTAPDSVVVRFTVTETALYRFDGLEVNGASEDLRELARRSVVDPTGRPFAPTVLDEARRDLRELGLFRQARVRADESGAGTLRLIAELTPRAPRTLSFGVGTWTDHPIQISAGWRHRNLFRRGRGFGVEGEFALRRSEVESYVNWPVLLRRRSESRFSTRYRIEDEEAYGAEVFGVAVDHRFRVGQMTSWSLGTSWTTTALDIRTELEEAYETVPGQQLLVEARWIKDAVDDLLDPTRGRRLQVEAAYAPPFSFAEATFASLRGAWVEVVPLASSTVMALRFDLAAARPVGDATDLLPTQRWYGGGFNTHRGAPRRGLGPTDADDDPLGGAWRGLAGAEIRQRFNDWAGMALFVDTGQVWEVRDDVSVRDLVVAIGAGPMISTPIGPLHLDFAWNVGELPSDGSRWVFNFGIGHAY